MALNSSTRDDRSQRNFCGCKHGKRGQGSYFSNFYDAMEAGVWVPGNPTIIIGGVTVPPLILADAAYPSQRWLMTPYTSNLNAEQATFNSVHSRARCVVEQAFGYLKARWCCRGAQLPVREKNVNSVISACVILHNICE